MRFGGRVAPVLKLPQRVGLHAEGDLGDLCDGLWRPVEERKRSLRQGAIGGICGSPLGRHPHEIHRRESQGHHGAVECGLGQVEE